jgi:predicted PurR-regulated permease PerM
MTGNPERRWPSAGETARTAVVVTAVVACCALLFAIVWLASKGLIAIGVGILLAVLLDAGTRGLGRLVGWPRPIRLIVVLFLSALALIGAIWWGGTVLVEQGQNFLAAMGSLFQRASQMMQNGFGIFPEGANPMHFLPSAGTLFGGATTVAYTTIGVISLFAAILFLGAFFAWEPSLYQAIVLSLIPKPRRERVAEVLNMAGDAMREWLIGQAISMSVIFLFSLTALELVGMPYPILLAVQAGLLTFVPTLGPFVAGVVIILAGLSQSWTMALYGLGTYLMIQFLETHLVTPLVQERTVRFPPGATLGVQVIAVFLFGLLGVAFVVPLTAAVKVLVEELYVKDRLGGPWQGEGQSLLIPAVHHLMRKIRRRNRG